jgi:hypothetical protein
MPCQEQYDRRHLEHDGKGQHHLEVHREGRIQPRLKLHDAVFHAGEETPAHGKHDAVAEPGAEHEEDGESTTNGIASFFSFA